uniref:Uncharacterized protein n=1 Tax=Romanomermis culicivorax TaxID=13658 RepID=A0A915L413_ROMCU
MYAALGVSVNSEFFDQGVDCALDEETETFPRQKHEPALHEMHSHKTSRSSINYDRDSQCNRTATR